MRQILLALFVALLSSPAFAGTKIVLGSLDEISEVKEIPVVLNWKEAVYRKDGKLEDFIAKADRDNEWEAKSLEYLIQRANKKIGEYGLVLVASDEAPDSPLYFELITSDISKSGDIKGEILLKSRESDEPLAILAFSSDDSDSNDSITFRDQFKSIGNSLGKLISDILKKQAY